MRVQIDTSGMALVLVDYLIEQEWVAEEKVRVHAAGSQAASQAGSQGPG